MNSLYELQVDKTQFSKKQLRLIARRLIALTESGTQIDLDTIHHELVSWVTGPLAKKTGEDKVKNTPTSVISILQKYVDTYNDRYDKWTKIAMMVIANYNRDVNVDDEVTINFLAECVYAGRIISTVQPPAQKVHVLKTSVA